ncbi:DUF4184 family protein [Streptomyces sp. NPDC004609]|uniref:DUF4184 family protein n=1 Tax=Streptomyces sp. NPDC004609 TaxID=3364704 RepID=UPI0036C0F45C
MPFTLSHVAAVLPGLRADGTARGPLVASALVMGSLSPDMTYFAATLVPGAMGFGRFTHSPAGVLTVDVAVTAVLVALWLMMREPLLALLPGEWQGRVHAVLRGRRGDKSPASGVWFCVSAVIGATTHVVWDAFTHHSRWGTEVLPVLNESVGGLHGYQLAQYGSSVLAAMVIVCCAVSALRRQPPQPAPPCVPVLDRRARRLAGVLLGGCLLAGAVERCVRWYGVHGQVGSALDLVPTACFGAGAGLALGLVVYGAGMRLRERVTARVSGRL